MGAEPYEYFVNYEADPQAALDKLRTDVFRSGEYRGAEFAPATAQDALEMMDADGTASILDIERITTQPDFCCAVPYSSDELQEYFGTARPSREDLVGNDLFWDDLERGQARYTVIYTNDEPTELLFVGYSFD